MKEQKIMHDRRRNTKDGTTYTLLRAHGACFGAYRKEAENQWVLRLQTLNSGRLEERRFETRTMREIKCLIDGMLDNLVMYADPRDYTGDPPHIGALLSDDLQEAAEAFKNSNVKVVGTGYRRFMQFRKYERGVHDREYGFALSNKDNYRDNFGTDRRVILFQGQAVGETRRQKDGNRLLTVSAHEEGVPADAMRWFKTGGEMRKFLLHRLFRETMTRYDRFDLPLHAWLFDGLALKSLEMEVGRCGAPEDMLPIRLEK